MKKKQITGIAILSLVVGGLASPGARAMSPGRVTSTGTPIKWSAFPIKYAIDMGDLGKMKHADAAALVDKAFQQWSGVDTAKIAFQKQADLTTDITGANLGNVLGALDPTVTPIIFDNDGTITEGVLGFTLGSRTFAFGGYLSLSADGASVTQGYVVVNGKAMDGLFDPDDPTPPDLQRAMMRAIGQMLFVGSSDTNDELRFNGNPDDNSAVPIMYPNNVIKGGTTLTLDDQMSLTDQYPSATADTKTGVIQGTVLLPDGVTGLQGIDVIAHRADDPTNAALNVSAISGITFRNPSGRGTTDPAARGAFKIRVPAGSYILEFRPERASMGPFGVPFPLPGGRQFYQASSPSAGPVDASMATVVTVTAGQSTPPLKLIAAGSPIAVSPAVTQVKPNDSPASAQPVGLSTTVTGTVSTSDSGQIVVLSPDGQGNFVKDKIENLYRIVVTQRSILTLDLQPTKAVDLDLFVLNSFRKDIDTDRVLAQAQTRNTGPESLQTFVDPGTYLIGVSAWDAVTPAVATDYKLFLTTTPLADQPAAPAPVLNQLVLGNVTDTGADVSWNTDLDATGDALVAMPLQQFGDPTAGKAHHVTMVGLTAGAQTDVTAVSQVLDGTTRNSLPKVFFRTADSAAATGPAQLNAGVVGLIGDSVDVPDSVLVAVAIQNSGGAATSVQITGLTPSPGWHFAQPPTLPLAVGNIGSGGTALVVVRLILDNATTPAPLASVAGTVAGAGGATANFTISGP